MKRYILLVLCVLFAFALFSCDEDATSESQEKSEAQSVMDEIKSEYSGAFDGNNTTEEIVPDW